MAEASRSWYVLRAISGKEAKVKEYIEAAVKNGLFGGFVSQVLIPTEKVVQQRAGKRVVKDRNYLPGYVLVEAELKGEVAHELRSTPNVLGFLGGMENPSPLTESEVNRILGKIDEIQEDADMAIPYSIGDMVKVNEGPFSGFSGEVVRIDRDKRKITVSVKVFGRPTDLSLGFMQVEKE